MENKPKRVITERCPHCGYPLKTETPPEPDWAGMIDGDDWDLYSGIGRLKAEGVRVRFLPSETSPDHHQIEIDDGTRTTPRRFNLQRHFDVVKPNYLLLVGGDHLERPDPAEALEAEADEAANDESVPAEDEPLAGAVEAEAEATEQPASEDQAQPAVALFDSPDSTDDEEE